MFLSIKGSRNKVNKIEEGDRKSLDRSLFRGEEKLYESVEKFST